MAAIKWKKFTHKTGESYEAKVSIFRCGIYEVRGQWHWNISVSDEEGEDVGNFAICRNSKKPLESKKDAQHKVESELLEIAADIIDESQEFCHIEYID